MPHIVYLCVGICVAQIDNLSTLGYSGMERTKKCHLIP